MLPKNRRLSAREVREVLRKGRSVRTSTISARFMQGKSGKTAILVSSKVAKKATERNKARRAAYQALPTLPPKMHVVFFIQKKDFDSRDILSICSKLS